MQRYAHLLGNRHEEIVENFEQDRIGTGAERVAARQRRCARQYEMVDRCHRAVPALFNDNGLMRLDDQRGPDNAMTGHKLVAPENRGVAWFTLAYHAAQGDRFRQRLAS